MKFVIFNCHVLGFVVQFRWRISRWWVVWTKLYFGCFFALSKYNIVHTTYQRYKRYYFIQTVQKLCTRYMIKHDCTVTVRWKLHTGSKQTEHSLSVIACFIISSSCRNVTFIAAKFSNASLALPLVWWLVSMVECLISIVRKACLSSSRNFCKFRISFFWFETLVSN